MAEPPAWVLRLRREPIEPHITGQACPTCGQVRTRDGRPALRAVRNRAVCRSCGPIGDMQDWLEANGVDPRVWAGGLPVTPPPPPPPRPSVYPPGAAELWAAAGALGRDELAWLDRRGIARRVASWGHVRRLPDGPLPEWAQGWRDRYTILTPLLDARGEVVSVRARSVDINRQPKSRAPKSTADTVYTTSGTWWAGPEAWPPDPGREVLVVEGEAAWLYAMGAQDRYVIGVHSGSARCPWSALHACPVTWATDGDRDGDNYAERWMPAHAIRERPPEGLGWDDAHAGRITENRTRRG